MLYHNSNITFDRIDGPTTVLFYDDTNTSYTYYFCEGDFVNGNKITYCYGYDNFYNAYIYEMDFSN